MSDWSYYDKSGVVDGVKEVRRTTKDTKDDVASMRKQIDTLTRNQEAILKAFNEMAKEMRALREEMYPTVKNTKPGLKTAMNPAQKRS
jgi:uncharacterized protein YoxC